MSWSKQDLIKRAFGKIGLASSTFEISAEQQQEALQDLDAMLADWNGRGIRLGYPIPSTAGGSKPEDDSCLPDWALRAVVFNLAMTIGPDVGKDVSQLAAPAKRSYDMLLARSAMPPERQMPSGMPAGAGHKRRLRPFLNGPTDSIEVGPDGDHDF